METCLIEPKICVAELFSRYPQTITVFLKHNMHCVGCCMAPFDALQEASANYSIDWDSFKSDLEQAIQTR